MAVAPTTGELRAALEQAAEWCSRYFERVDELPVLARVEPGQIGAMLPEHPPAAGEPLTDILADVERVIMPGITHWNHPGFMAYFGITGSPAGVVGETIAAPLNVNAMLWRTSPAATELEQRTLAWVAELLGLPAGWFGEITDTASASTMYALAAAREAAGLEIRQRGMAGRADLPQLRVYASEQAHSAVEKACISLGLGQQGLAKVPTDREFRMRPDLLAEAMERDAAAVVPEMRHVLDGCDRADSLVINPHKWLFPPVDCSLLYTARPDELRAAFSLIPEYLRTDDDGVVNLMDYGLSLGRRFRALKLWMVIRAYGADGLAALISGHMELARRLEAAIAAEHGWELLAPVPFSTVCFRRRPPGVDDEAELRRLNAAIIERVNATGRAFVSHTDLGGRYAIRVAIGNAATSAEHVDGVWELMREAAG